MTLPKTKPTGNSRFQLYRNESLEDILLRLADGKKELVSEAMQLAAPGVKVDISDLINFITHSNSNKDADIEKAKVIKEKYEDINNNYYLSRSRAYQRYRAVKEKALEKVQQRRASAA